MIKITNTKLFKTGRWREIPKLVRIMETKSLDLAGADLRGADLRFADLRGAKLRCADLREADLRGAKLRCADLREADLSFTDLSFADLSFADLRGANLRFTNLCDADLYCASLYGADLHNVNMCDANLCGANLACAVLINTKGLKKPVGFKVGDIAYKKIEKSNNGYYWRLGMNYLRPGEVFSDDERVLCSYPGFHFASKELCEEWYGERPYLAKIRIPEGVEINEPWASSGNASASAIEILEVTDREGKDVSELFKDAADGHGGRAV